MENVGKTFDELDERKLLILKAIIDDYIESKEPVGSRTISKKPEMSCSPATIRNDMADLEEMGYLSQPHTSAGRIPSDKAYRLYVDKLMRIGELETVPTVDELNEIKSHMQIKINELSQQIRFASEIVSRITDYTAIALTTGDNKTKRMKALQIVPISEGEALIVIVLENDAVRNCMIKIDNALNPELIVKISTQCNLLFAGHRIEDISLDMINTAANTAGAPRNLILPIVDGIFECIKKTENDEIHLEGAARLLSHPEFNDVDKASKLIELLNNKDVLKDLVKDCAHDGLTVKIGSETNIEGMDDCSVITASYSVDGIDIGTISVLGPTRMDYPKVISALEYVRHKLNESGTKVDMNILPKGESRK